MVYKTGVRVKARSKHSHTGTHPYTERQAPLRIPRERHSSLRPSRFLRQHGLKREKKIVNRIRETARTGTQELETGTADRNGRPERAARGENGTANSKERGKGVNRNLGCIAQ